MLISTPSHRPWWLSIRASPSITAFFQVTDETGPATRQIELPVLNAPDGTSTPTMPSSAVNRAEIGPRSNPSCCASFDQPRLGTSVAHT